MIARSPGDRLPGVKALASHIIAGFKEPPFKYALCRHAHFSCNLCFLVFLSIFWLFFGIYVIDVAVRQFRRS